MGAELTATIERTYALLQSAESGAGVGYGGAADDGADDGAEAMPAERTRSLARSATRVRRDATVTTLTVG